MQGKQNKNTPWHQFILTIFKVKNINTLTAFLTRLPTARLTGMATVQVKWTRLVTAGPVRASTAHLTNLSLDRETENIFFILGCYWSSVANSSPRNKQKIKLWLTNCLPNLLIFFFASSWKLPEKSRVLWTYNCHSCQKIYQKLAEKYIDLVSYQGRRSANCCRNNDNRKSTDLDILKGTGHFVCW